MTEAISSLINLQRVGVCPEQYTNFISILQRLETEQHLQAKSVALPKACDQNRPAVKANEIMKHYKTTARDTISRNTVLFEQCTVRSSPNIPDCRRTCRRIPLHNISNCHDGLASLNTKTKEVIKRVTKSVFWRPWTMR